MIPLDQIKKNVAALSYKELVTFKRWFEEYFADAWDRQIEADIRAGKLDHLAEQALRDVKAGRYTEL